MKRKEVFGALCPIAQHIPVMDFLGQMPKIGSFGLKSLTLTPTKKSTESADYIFKNLILVGVMKDLRFFRAPFHHKLYR